MDEDNGQGEGKEIEFPDGNQTRKAWLALQHVMTDGGTRNPDGSLSVDINHQVLLNALVEYLRARQDYSVEAQKFLKTRLERVDRERGSETDKVKLSEQGILERIFGINWAYFEDQMLDNSMSGFVIEYAFGMLERLWVEMMPIKEKIQVMVPIVNEFAETVKEARELDEANKRRQDRLREMYGKPRDVVL